MYAAQLACTWAGPASVLHTPETAIIIPSTRRTARLAAGLLLSLMLAPALAGQPVHGQRAPRCDDGSGAAAPCPAANQSDNQPAKQPVKQRAEAGRRSRAAAAADGECSRLTTAIVESEAAELRPRSALMESVQQDLAALRKRYKALGCQETRP